MCLASLEHIAVAACEHFGLFDTVVTLRARDMNHKIARKIETCCDHGLTSGQFPLESFMLQLMVTSCSKSWARSAMYYVVNAAMIGLEAAKALLIGGIDDGPNLQSRDVALPQCHSSVKFGACKIACVHEDLLSQLPLQQCVHCAECIISWKELCVFLYEVDSQLLPELPNAQRWRLCRFSQHERPCGPDQLVVLRHGFRRGCSCSRF
mmetsp:Transcript_116398/g.205824  ORF Transcript_116398/g.205824 Transcript_116398/m.205824 type:complete len:208 (+) Transcript_116398:215-838(+)